MKVTGRRDPFHGPAALGGAPDRAPGPASRLPEMTDAALRRWQAVCLVAAAVFLGLALGAATGVMPGDQPVRESILALGSPESCPPRAG